MRQRFSSNWGSAAVVAGLLVGLLAWPTVSEAQTVSGRAAAVKASTLGLFGATTTTLADTGSLYDSMDARDASLNTAGVPALLTGEALHATTIGSPDQVASEASLADLSLGVAGNTIGAGFVMARALALSDGGGFGDSNLDALTVNGVPIGVTGEPNQTVFIPGGRVVINEQWASAGSIVVNALHVIVDGVADVVIGSATAGVQ
jgi:hypothetical protein